MVRGQHLLLPLAIAVALAGCKTNPSGRSPVQPPPAEPAPAGDRPAARRDGAPPQPLLIAPENVAITGAVLMSNTEYETSIPLKIKFGPKMAGADPDVEFEVLVGPVPTRGNAATWMVANPDFEIVIGEGFAYLSVIMQTNETYDRFFLLHAPAGKSMTVTSLLAAVPPKIVSKHMHFVDVRNDGTISDPDPIPVDTTDPVYVFVDSVIRQGVDAGMAGPRNWPPGTF